MGTFADWDELLAYAREFDLSWPHDHPPAPMEPLVAAAARTSLRRFVPYTSHAILRFAMVEKHWRDDQPQPPVSIGTASSPDEYIVFWGQMVSEVERATILLLTPSPEEAVGLAASLLRGWPYSYPMRPPCFRWRTPDEWCPLAAYPDLPVHHVV